MVCFSLISLFCSCHLSYHSTCASCQIVLGHKCQFGNKSGQLGSYYLLKRSLKKKEADREICSNQRRHKLTPTGGKFNAVIGSQSHQDLACPFWGQNEGQGTVAVGTSRRGRYGGRHVVYVAVLAGSLGPLSEIWRPRFIFGARVPDPHLPIRHPQKDNLTTSPITNPTNIHRSKPTNPVEAATPHLTRSHHLAFCSQPSPATNWKQLPLLSPTVQYQLLRWPGQSRGSPRQLQQKHPARPLPSCNLSSASISWELQPDRRPPQTRAASRHDRYSP